MKSPWTPETITSARGDLAQCEANAQRAEAMVRKLIDDLGDIGVHLATAEILVPVQLCGVKAEPIKLTFSTEAL